MITAKGLQQLGFVSEIDFVLQDNGNGALMENGLREQNPFIADWNSAQPQPTEQVIETAHDLWETEQANTVAQKAADKESANQKLRDIGLTDAEIIALTGSA